MTGQLAMLSASELSIHISFEDRIGTNEVNWLKSYEYSLNEGFGFSCDNNELISDLCLCYFVPSFEGDP